MSDWFVEEANRINSPNKSVRKHKIKTIVLHTTICPRETPDNYDRVKRWLLNKNASGSTHFVILRNGRVLQGVPCDETAWHAGESSWVTVDGTKINKCNHWAIGIDFDSVGPVTRKGDKMYDCYGSPFSGPTAMHGKKEYECYTIEQLTSAAKLIPVLLDAYGIDPADVVGHCDVSPGRKEDPAYFPWWMLRDMLTAEHRIDDLSWLKEYDG